MSFKNDPFKSYVRQPSVKFRSGKHDYFSSDEEKNKLLDLMNSYPLASINETNDKKRRYNLALTHQGKDFQVADEPLEGYGIDGIHFDWNTNIDPAYEPSGAAMRIEKSPDSNKPIITQIVQERPSHYSYKEPKSAQGLHTSFYLFDYPTKMAEALKEHSDSEGVSGNFYNLIFEFDFGWRLYPYSLLLPKGMGYQEASFYLFSHINWYAYYHKSKLYIDNDCFCLIANGFVE